MAAVRLPRRAREAERSSSSVMILTASVSLRDFALARLVDLLSQQLYLYLSL
jgi:hypothetical protein